MKKAIISIVCTLTALILALAAVGVFGFWLPYNEAVSSFGLERNVNMYLQEDGTVRIL